MQAPFRHAFMLRGSENIMRDMYNQKENLRELCEIVLSSLIVNAAPVISTDIDIIFMSNPTSSGNAIFKKQ